MITSDGSLVPGRYNVLWCPLFSEPNWKVVSSLASRWALQQRPLRWPGPWQAFMSKCSIYQAIILLRFIDRIQTSSTDCDAYSICVFAPLWKSEWKKVPFCLWSLVVPMCWRFWRCSVAFLWVLLRQFLVSWGTRGKTKAQSNSWRKKLNRKNC